MHQNKKFEVRMDPDAARHYQKLDNSVVGAVNKAIDELEIRADKVGKPLENKNSSKLAGCKEIKLRQFGIRIIFRVTNETVDILRIVLVLAIERRNKDLVFRVTDSVFRNFKRIPKSEIKEFLSRKKLWKDERKGKK